MSRYVTLPHDPEFTFIQSPEGTFPFLLLEIGSFPPNSQWENLMDVGLPEVSYYQQQQQSETDTSVK
jgi:hypothetical protein